MHRKWLFGRSLINASGDRPVGYSQIAVALAAVVLPLVSMGASQALSGRPEFPVLPVAAMPTTRATDGLDDVAPSLGPGPGALPSPKAAQPPPEAAQPQEPRAASPPITMSTFDTPNIVVLMLDDQPPLAPSFYATLPNINAQFIEQGIRFSNYWANFSLCCPGRATFLTGQLAHHHGVTKNDARLFDPRVSLASELHSAGYHTMICGKYFNGVSGLSDKTPVGWDDVAIKAEGPYFDYPAWINGLKERHGNLVTDYSTDVMAAHCHRFLQNAPSDKPLFALMTPNATHGGRDENGTKVPGQPVAAPRHRGDSRCANLPPWKPASYNEADVSDKPAYIKRQPLLKQTGGWNLQRACEAMLSVDEWLGGAIELLRGQGRLDNTVFVLTADNGMGWGAHRWIDKVAPHTAQMPLFISWSGAMGSTVAESDALVTNADMAPTLCELGACTMGPFPNGFGVDGQSFAGLITDTYSSLPERDAIVLEGSGGTVPGYRAILTSSDHQLGKWLYVTYPGTGERELYNLSGGPCLGWKVGAPGDPCMMRNVGSKARFRDVRRSLRIELDSMW